MRWDEGIAAGVGSSAPSGYLLKHCHSASTAGFACIQVRRVLSQGRAFAISQPKQQTSALVRRSSRSAESSRVLWPGEIGSCSLVFVSRPSTMPARPSGLRARHCLQARAVLRKASLVGRRRARYPSLGVGAVVVRGVESNHQSPVGSLYAICFSGAQPSIGYKEFAQRSKSSRVPDAPPPPPPLPHSKTRTDVQTRIVLFLLTYPAMSISDPCEDDEPATQPRQNGTGTLRSPREATSALNPSRPERLLIILSFRSSSCWLCSSGGIPRQ